MLVQLFRTFGIAANLLIINNDYFCLELIFLCVVVMLLIWLYSTSLLLSDPFSEMISIQNIWALFLAYSPAL